ncbi:glycine zipper family protein [Motilimonas pumila]|uniref:Glycine zipper family protein n=1 Tax=Motilimonas pumila TaxID=2303987 RepID=A0A418YBL4_9GAMM|nr:glycine zipper family protein [Motilimonas pumila]RJG41863.1 glycine zipper family protein [Motilimonas pumila]
MKKLFIPLFLFSSFASASVIVDTKDVDEKDYIYDMQQCEQLAGQVQKQESNSRGALATGAKGAAAGAAYGAISGGSGTSGAKTGAGVGVATGIFTGSKDRRDNEKQHKAEQQQVVKNCMTQRGYVVLN